MQCIKIRLSIFFSPFSLSIIFSARIIGPTLGYILGSTCLSIYVDPGHIPNGMDQDHPRYIGAWWIGFIVIAIFLMIFSPMLTLFPSRLPAENETDAKKVERELSEDEKPQSVMDWWKEFIGIVVTRFYCRKRVRLFIFVFSKPQLSANNFE